MSDPAVEAARRAALLGSCGDGPEDYAENAAREALKPVRELHRKSPLYDLADDCDICSSEDDSISDQHERIESADGDFLCTAKITGHCCRHCTEILWNDGDPVEWPCETAKLIYPESELAQ